MERCGVPLGPVANTILDDLCLGDGADLLEELLQLAGAETSGQLLDKDGAPVALVPGRGGVAGSALSGATAVILAATIPTVVTVAVAAVFSGMTVAVGRAGARAATAVAVASAVVISVGSMTT
jgi:hypothetical protein